MNLCFIFASAKASAGEEDRFALLLSLSSAQGGLKPLTRSFNLIKFKSGKRRELRPSSQRRDERRKIRKIFLRTFLLYLRFRKWKLGV